MLLRDNARFLILLQMQRNLMPRFELRSNRGDAVNIFTDREINVMDERVKLTLQIDARSAIVALIDRRKRRPSGGTCSAITDVSSLTLLQGQTYRSESILRLCDPIHHLLRILARRAGSPGHDIPGAGATQDHLHVELPVMVVVAIESWQGRDERVDVGGHRGKGLGQKRYGR